MYSIQKTIINIHIDSIQIGNLKIKNEVKTLPQENNTKGFLSFIKGFLTSLINFCSLCS